MSEFFWFFVSCCKCIFWCWWARGVYGDVSRVLQTRKTTKICAEFLIIHYNRDLNTNWTSSASRHSAKKDASYFFRREIDLLKPLLGVTVIPASSVWTWLVLCMAPELMPLAQVTREISGHQYPSTFFNICNTALRAFLRRITCHWRWSQYHPHNTNDMPVWQI